MEGGEDDPPKWNLHEIDHSNPHFQEGWIYFYVYSPHPYKANRPCCLYLHGGSNSWWIDDQIKTQREVNKHGIHLPDFFDNGVPGLADCWGFNVIVPIAPNFDPGQAQGKMFWFRPLTDKQYSAWHVETDEISQSILSAVQRGIVATRKHYECQNAPLVVCGASIGGLGVFDFLVHSSLPRPVAASVASPGWSSSYVEEFVDFLGNYPLQIIASVSDYAWIPGDEKETKLDSLRKLCDSIEQRNYSKCEIRIVDDEISCHLGSYRALEFTLGAYFHREIRKASGDKKWVPHFIDQLRSTDDISIAYYENPDKNVLYCYQRFLERRHRAYLRKKPNNKITPVEHHPDIQIRENVDLPHEFWGDDWPHWAKIWPNLPGTPQRSSSLPLTPSVGMSAAKGHSKGSFEFGPGPFASSLAKGAGRSRKHDISPTHTRARRKLNSESCIDVSVSTELEKLNISTAAASSSTPKFVYRRPRPIELQNEKDIIYKTSPQFPRYRPHWLEEIKWRDDGWENLRPEDENCGILYNVCHKKYWDRLKTMQRSRRVKEPKKEKVVKERTRSVPKRKKKKWYDNSDQAWQQSKNKNKKKSKDEDWHWQSEQEDWNWDYEKNDRYRNTTSAPADRATQEGTRRQRKSGRQGRSWYNRK